MLNQLYNKTSCQDSKSLSHYYIVTKVKIRYKHYYIIKKISISSNLEFKGYYYLNVNICASNVYEGSTSNCEIDIISSNSIFALLGKFIANNGK